MAQKLPPELLPNIIFQVFYHVRHLNTLYSLLFTSKYLFREAAKVLYYDPFEATTLAISDSALPKLLTLIFSLSPLDDEDTNTFRALLNLPKIENPTIDYLNLILSNKMQLTTAYEYWSSDRLIHEAGYNGDKLEADFLSYNLQVSLALAIYGGRLSHFKRIQFPWWGIKRLSLRARQLTNLQVLESDFELKFQNLPCYLLDYVVGFVQRMQAVHGPHQLTDIWWRSRVKLQSDTMEIRDLDDILPPLMQPTFFDPWMFWRSFWSDGLTNIDLSRVTTVRIPQDLPPQFNICRDNHLQRCRHLKSLTLHHDNSINVLGWAVDERRQYEALQRQPQVLVAARPACAGEPLDLLRPVQLQELSIENGDYALLDAAMYAFGPSLKKVSFRFMDDAPIQACGTTWDLPKLISLELQSNVEFYLHPEAFDNLRSLLSLRLDICDRKYEKSILNTLGERFSLGERWTRLTNLRTLHLVGLASFATNPFQGSQHQRDCHLAAPYPNHHLWTWDWDMPSLRIVVLGGDMASHFRFQWLKNCPRLEVLELDITGGRRELDLSDFAIMKSAEEAGDEESTTCAVNLKTQFPPLSQTLRELYLTSADKHSWHFSSDSALEALLRACGPRLTYLCCHTADSDSFRHLTHLAQTSYRQLERIGASSAMDGSVREECGLEPVGKAISWTIA
ncbi:hypothetical protein BGZ73_004098 [Actinomortierella ambigua]|nr:hypothetical protein BGZ73_004098 [Actinomortierella ambigua]